MTRPKPSHPPADRRNSTSVTETPETGSGNSPRTDDESAALSPADNGRDPAPGDMPHSSVDLTVADASSAPAMPHERDEAVGMTDGIASKRVQQAFDDVEAGRQDTSRGLETDRAYQRQKEGR